MEKKITVLSIILFAVLRFAGIALIDSACWSLFFFSVVGFIGQLTRRINILEAVNIIACMMYLIFPLLVFNIFNEKNAYAFRWKSFMLIDKIEYFSFALPATALFILGMSIPLSHKRISDIYLIQQARTYLLTKGAIGYYFIIIGLFFAVLVPLVGESIRAIFYYFGQLTFVGSIYLIHSNISSKKTVLLFILSLLLIQVVLTGMYGELIFWSMLGSIILLVGKTKFNLFKRIMLIACGVFLILLIQSIKHEYRDKVWNGTARGNDPALLFQLVKSRIQNPTTIFDPERIYNITVRGNQGFLVARVMDYVPKNEPFAHGETILNSVLSSLVPRIFWNDKPRVGGHENICRFLGDCGRYNYSYNIGQLGEAYANFGKAGGAFFMLIYGLFINWCFLTIKTMSLRHPTLILWIPLLFFAVLSLETDVLTFLNSFAKGCIFCWICFYSFRLLFRIKI